MHPTPPPKRSAFTLIELLVVVAIIALLIAILLPSLGRAREQTKQTKCLANMRSWGQGVAAYVAEERDYLPGPLHPAIYRWQGLSALMNNPIQSMGLTQAQYQQSRFLSFKLRRQFGSSDGSSKSVADDIGTCPTLASINPDSNFVRFKAIKSRNAFPTHLVINNAFPLNFADPDGGGVSQSDANRTTNPQMYFGYSPSSDPVTSGNTTDLTYMQLYPPKAISKIHKTAEEWMIADAWYRKGAFPLSPFYQQEGPYQSYWTGEALPFFAPHFGPLSSYSYSDNRESLASAVRNSKRDGRTVTLFFDGHSDPVSAKRCLVGVEGDAEQILYGFRGTVNPYDPYLPPREPPSTEPDPQGVIPYWE